MIMDPVRLHFLLTLAVQTSGLSPLLAGLVFAQSLRQLHEWWPLAGCAVKYGGPTTHVIAVGRQ